MIKEVIQSQFFNVCDNTLEIYSFFDLAKILLSDHHMCASMSSSKMQSSCNMIKMHEHVYIKYFQFLAKKKIDPRKICPCLTKNNHTKNFSFFAKVLFSSSWVSVYFLGILWVFLQTNLPMVEPFSNGKWQNIPWHIRWLSSLGPFPVTLQT